MSKNTVNKVTKKIVCGNWKMNPLSLKEAEKLLIEISKSFSLIKKTEIIICPPFIYLEPLRRLLKAKSYKLKPNLGAQDSFWGDKGAYTGEISVEMLYNIGARYVILGHSERRALGENNNDINKKIKASISAGLRPILCVGESIRDENHEYLNFIKMQIEECLNGISKDSISKVIIAYEPIWAIGKGSYPATPEEFREMNIFIRKILNDKFGAKMIGKIRIIYGGSADEKNTEGFIKDGEADGFLLGRASLDAKKFSKIVEICETLDK
ncbi:triose-phosphate isomerase [Candidatus Nomurabacteria bacterium CG_4_9_14_0_2_um_filter_32_10]|uniref:Triosephosphate isomerase n=3 Tax=Candidatus Nomuraibacteriota TaxID=1752729 RepID=A0A2H0CGK9_9BACT|nr:MAG: triose-phosphate isomerase [Candidatus Nomurabacteria bacterium CG22_combo_CG10-13_8_21_14_all_32_8]PIZ85396.1 MAG: triose-phosphate isomerase [Candidatus Nomurabacteria bacterium CG_4_10_14_0_2_um_filter_33_9]PJC49570.1 MAG: triose-phosphate isomerase [Candidatus Nomurabacteria bacterium CG_4_9_14_0_2_um_filter_32_10]